MSRNEKAMNDNESQQINARNDNKIWVRTRNNIEWKILQSSVPLQL